MKNQKAVKERPILCNGETVRAILDGRKTQFRRIVKPQPQLLNGRFEFSGNNGWPAPDVWLALTPSGKFGLTKPPYYKCPFGTVGDHLWVRENFCIHGGRIHYAADEKIAEGPNWKPSIHMPKSASRITLEITDIRVERLQDISEEDAKAEGVDASKTVEMKDGSPCYTLPFQMLWTSVYGADSWNANPWVWAITFQKL